MTNLFYALDENNEPYPLKDTPTKEQWANLWRIVDYVHNHKVSTVFLGVDFGNVCMSRPILFETMVFEDNGKGNGIYMIRYHNIEEAKKGHEKAIEWVKNGCRDNE